MCANMTSNVTTLHYHDVRLRDLSSPTGNRTPASRVTGGDTDHYTIEDSGAEYYIIM